jgi:hypothetical protein
MNNNKRNFANSVSGEKLNERYSFKWYLTERNDISTDNVFFLNFSNNLCQGCFPKRMGKFADV